jgi:hypothetical protein
MVWVDKRFVAGETKSNNERKGRGGKTQRTRRKESVQLLPVDVVDYVQADENGEYQSDCDGCDVCVESQFDVGDGGLWGLETGCHERTPAIAVTVQDFVWGTWAKTENPRCLPEGFSGAVRGCFSLRRSL